MAKITPYKFVNPGVVGTSSVPVVRATSTNLLATNRIGLAVEGIANSLFEITENNKALVVFFKQQGDNSRKQLQLQRDSEAEAKQENAKIKLNSYNDKKAKDKEEALDTGDVKKEGEGFLGWADKFFAPFANIFKDIATIMIAKGVTDFLNDDAKQGEIRDFFRKAFEVGEVVYNFFDKQVKGFLDGWKKLSDPNNDFLTRLGGLGDMFKGIILLRYLMNPFALIEDIFTIIDGIGTFFDKKAKGQLTPDGKPKKTDAQLKKMGLTDEQIKAYRKAREGGATATQALQQARKVPVKPKGFLGRTVDAVGGALTQAQKKLMATARSTWGLVSEASQKLYAQLGEAARKQWENMVTMGKKLAARSTQVASSVGNKFGDAAKFLKDGALNLADNAKKAVQDKLLKPVFEFIQPLTDRLKLLAGKIQDALFGTPLGKQAAEALKKRGLFPPLDNLGPLTKKLGGKAIPILGGLVNLLFAYDRFQGGDPFGGMLEAISAGFDLLGLVPGGQFGPPISLGIDAYMLARDFVPGIQQGEEAIINSLPGAKAIGNEMKSLGAKLPPLSGLLGAMGIGNAPPKKAIGGVVNPTPRTNPSTQPGGYAADTGLDIIGKTGDPIVAPVSGTLEYAERGHVAQMGQDSDPRKPGIQDQHSFRIKLDKPFTYAGKKVNFAYGTHLAELHKGVKDKSGIHVKAGTLMGTMGVANKVPHLHLGFVEDRAQNRFLNFREMKNLFKGAPSSEVTDTSGMLTGSSLSGGDTTLGGGGFQMPKFENAGDAIKFMVGEMGKLFGPAKDANANSSKNFDPSLNLNVAEKLNLKDMDVSKAFAMDSDADIVPIAFTRAEPIYVPMPINNGDKVINAFKSPLLNGK